MLLYSKTTSERASKGQGGNEYLNIDILDENKTIIINLLVRLNSKTKIISQLDFFYRASLFPIINIVDITKGKSQKGECKCEFGKIQENCSYHNLQY